MCTPYKSLFCTHLYNNMYSNNDVDRGTGNRTWREYLVLRWAGGAGTPLRWNPRAEHKIHISVQLLSRVLLFATPRTAACQASLSITNSWSLLRPHDVHWVSDAIQPSHPLCRPPLLLPSIFPSIRIFSKESALHIRWPKDWSFSFNTSPSNEHLGQISFRMDWLDLLESPRDSQETSPTPHFKSINSSVLSFLYSPTLTSIHDNWKNHSLD